MLRNSLLTENQLDEWVRSHARDAQGVIVGLVYRLVAAASPRPKERRFPLGDSSRITRSSVQCFAIAY